MAAFFAIKAPLLCAIITNLDWACARFSLDLENRLCYIFSPNLPVAGNCHPIVCIHACTPYCILDAMCSG